MTRKFLKKAAAWGVTLWLIGYILGILLFAIVPASLIGYVIMPIGLIITIWVILKRFGTESFKNLILLGIVWILIAVIFDYFFLVMLFKPVDGYYKLDVFIYYILTFLLPIFVGLRRNYMK